MKPVVAVALTAMGLGCAVAASAQELRPDAQTAASDPQESRVGEYLTQPDWVRTSTIGELEKLYPASARATRVRGRVDAICDINAEGRFTDCAVQAETPPGHDLGRATLQALPSFQIAPTNADGRSVAGLHIRLTFVWTPQPAAGPSGLSVTVTPVPGAPGTAASAPPARPLILWATSNWAQIPTGDQMAEAYPEAARAGNLEGHTKIRCAVEKDGRLTDCVIVEETPSSNGFGRAAIAVSRFFRLHPTLGEGQPVEGGTVFLPISWRLAGF